MSVIQLALRFVFDTFGFLFSLPGVFTFFAGVIVFISLPFIPRLTGEFDSFRHFMVGLMASPIHRAAVVVSEHNDLLFKQMRFSDRGVEVIHIGDVDKEFEDPENRLSHFKGLPFALADEVHGVLFAPQDAACGQRKHDADAADESFVWATPEEANRHDVYGFVKGVFELPQNTYELVDLARVRHLFSGDERADDPDTVEDMYRFSRLPYLDDTPITRFFFPVLAFLMTFGGIWLVTSQGGTGGGIDTTIGFGTLLLWGGRDRPDIDIDWRRVAIILAVVLPLPLLGLLLMGAFGLWTTAVISTTFCFGVAFLMLVSVVTRFSARLSGRFASLFFMLGLAGFEKPVFEWTPDGYRLREYAELPQSRVVKWYGLAGSLVGFTYTPGDGTFPTAAMDHQRLEAAAEPLADGGTESNIPPGYTRWPGIKRAVYGGFIPERIRPDTTYVHSGIVTGWFAGAAAGEKCKRRLKYAKEKYGDNGFGVSDKAILYLTAGGGLIGVILGTLVFLL